MKYDLSICIPARNEIFLKNTIDDILKHKEGKTEIIIGLDGEWADPPLDSHPDVTIIYHNKSIGQRAMTNDCVKLSQAKYIIKVDAHCAFDQGFDVKLMADMQDNWCMVPVMRNLHVFDWKCYSCGFKKYQGPTPIKCPNCSKEGFFKRKIMWLPKQNPQSTAYCFDTEPHFQYMNDFKKRPEGKGDITETMSLQGSFMMMTRDKYWELNIGDESFGSWGSQGIQVACSFWLSGGRVVCNHKTYYGHLFRTQGGDFGFPYPNPGSIAQSAKKLAKNKLLENNFPHQIHPSSWLIDKFKPVKGWHDKEGEKALNEINEAGKNFKPSK